MSDRVARDPEKEGTNVNRKATELRKELKRLDKVITSSDLPGHENIGWRCANCGHDEYRFNETSDLPSSDRVLEHIRVEHPEIYEAGAWRMDAIKPNEDEF